MNPLHLLNETKTLSLELEYRKIGVGDPVVSRRWRGGGVSRVSNPISNYQSKTFNLYDWVFEPDSDPTPETSPIVGGGVRGLSPRLS